MNDELKARVGLYLAGAYEYSIPAMLVRELLAEIELLEPLREDEVEIGGLRFAASKLLADRFRALKVEWAAEIELHRKTAPVAWMNPSNRTVIEPGVRDRMIEQGKYGGEFAIAAKTAEAFTASLCECDEAPAGFKLLKDTTHEERSFPGDYSCECLHCKRMFTGHKRQAICRVCSNEPKGSPNTFTPTNSRGPS